MKSWKYRISYKQSQQENEAHCSSHMYLSTIDNKLLIIKIMWYINVNLRILLKLLKNLIKAILISYLHFLLDFLNIKLIECWWLFKKNPSHRWSWNILSETSFWTTFLYLVLVFFIKYVNIIF